MLRRRGRDQQVEALLFEAIEAEMPRNDPAPRAAAYAFFSRALPTPSGLAAHCRIAS
jgi:hypothetical protein